MDPVLPTDLNNAIRDAVSDAKVVNINIQVNNGVNALGGDLRSLQTPPILQKYSRNHEFSISSLASLVLHVGFVFGAIALAALITWNANADMPIEAISLTDGGGGGNPNGVGPGRGDGGTPLVEAATPRDLPPDAVLPKDPLIDDYTIPPADLLKDLTLDKETEREIAKIAERGTQSLQKLAKLDKKLREGLLGKGQGGPGAGGGSGSGDGPGTGAGDGPNSGSIRVKRKLRWTILFNTVSGIDYLRQLDALGAILAVKTPDGELKTIRNPLERPVKLETEDLQKLNRIFWIDDKQDTVQQLAHAMGLSFTPPQIIALFPYKFERELLDKELKFRNRKEEEIQETRFQILMRGGKNYQIVVIDQRYVR